MYLTVVLPFLFCVSCGADEALFFNESEQAILEFGAGIVANISLLFSNSSPDSIQFLLYEKGNDFPIVIADENATAHVNISFNTYFIIHGWIHNGTLPYIKEAARRLHQVGNFNVIAVDWRILASGNYFSAVRNIKVVGYRIKKFIKTVNLVLDKVIIVGHSLGAQVASYVGAALEDEKIFVIVGLDPAGPVFDWPFLLPPQNRLTSDDAKIVQVIHTMMFFTGVSISCGTIDFYVNEGTNQPGCQSGLPNDNIFCSHSKAHTYFIQTITNLTLYQGVKPCLINGTTCIPDSAYMGFRIEEQKFGDFEVVANASDINPDTEY